MIYHEEHEGHEEILRNKYNLAQFKKTFVIFVSFVVSISFITIKIDGET